MIAGCALVLFFIFASAQAATTGSTGRHGTAVQVPLRVYHDFGTQAPGEIMVSSATFAWQLHHRKSHGYRVIRLRD